MPALFPWAPPLPFVNELVSLVTFVLDNLDDLCEDGLKLLLLAAAAAAAMAAWRAAAAVAGPAAALPGLERLGAAAAVAAVGAAYPLADQLSDDAARHGQGLQETLRAAAGLPPHEPDPPDLVLTERSAAINIVDDVVEDAFKAACVFSHYTMGALLGGTMRRVIAGWLEGSSAESYAAAAGRAASALVIVGTPAGRYSTCDRFGDRLGDLVQQTLIDWAGAT